MLDIGWTELLVIAIVLIVVVGPKDLPPMLRAFGKMTSNLRKMAGDFRTQFDEALREADMDDVRKTISDAKSLNPANALRDAINPLRQMGQEIREDLQKATAVPKPSESVTSADDPLLTGEAADEAADTVTPQTATAPVQPAAPASTAAVVPAADVVAAAVAAKQAAAAATPAVPEVPVRKPRAPRKTVEAPATAEPVVTKPKPVAKATKVAAPKAAAAKATAPKPTAAKIAPAKAVATKAPAKKAAQSETAAAAVKTPRAPKKATAPKDEA
ncbi:Sec-independent protein translocase protein TatB [Neorhizobium sp. JUb45]|uniref:Sec-independent protein translocase protein TatB n=1 Tax=unclassified Neorhizobium TaxID=2629175 RepID=UPI00105141C0|nr:Sec-independent protein translocase protein TatB [Neorhizobium sp. JUb45]TCR04831.1 sec-independent protein translocase protein TatB [Neorhizobium sp. JUb45]